MSIELFIILIAALALIGLSYVCGYAFGYADGLKRYVAREIRKNVQKK